MSLQESTIMNFSMDQRLSEAYKCEKKADKYLENEDWDEAEQHYAMAAEMMREEMDWATSTSMTMSLILKIEKVDEKKGEVDKKRKEAKRRKASKKRSTSSRQSEKSFISNELHVPENRETAAKSLLHTEHSEKQGAEMAGQSRSRFGRNRAVVSTLASLMKYLPKDFTSIWQESVTDSLQFLYLSVDEKDNQFRSESRAKKPKSKEEILEQYDRRCKQTAVLQQTVEGLIKALEDKEKENEFLEARIESLKTEKKQLLNWMKAYGDDQGYVGLRRGHDNFVSEDGSTTTSLFLNQSGSSEDFNKRRLEFELADAAKEITPPDDSGASSTMANRSDSPTLSGSVNYKLLREALENDVSDRFEDSEPICATPPPPRYVNLAELPPISLPPISSVQLDDLLDGFSFDD